MATIDVDFEVFKALTNRRATEAVSYNDVLREMLGLEDAPATPVVATAGWTWKGVTLPEGTEIKAEYKGKAYTAKIEGGKWVQDGKTHTSPSAAAHAITGSGVNGWWFWFVKRPSDATWHQMGKLRAA
ncbi:MAG: hypothetical protein DI585_04390 [Pseudomonas fluorescens]|nr:MAG: hypothetical protein DI585_04390 [Pseudomonas fluorescens]